MTISESILKEADILLISFLMGIILVFVYDLIRILRRIIPHGKWWIAAEDFLFWAGCAIAVFVMLFHVNDGYLRGFSIGGVVVGMLFYNLLLSRIVIKCSMFILEKVLYVLFRPLVFLIKLLKRPFGCVKKRVKNVLRFFRKQLKKFKKAVKMCIYKQ